MREKELKRLSERSPPTGPVLKKRREQLGFARADLADMIGVSAQTIRNWEHDERSPAGANALALLDVVGPLKPPEGGVLAANLFDRAREYEAAGYPFPESLAKAAEFFIEKADCE